jgi:hypothetical protein
MMRCCLIAVLVASGCGDNTFATGEPIGHADVVLFGAHTDDDMIFMQPELLDAVRGRSIATVYFTVGDAVKGPGLARGLLHASKTAYAAMVGGGRWDCGYVELTVPVQHCRLLGHDISIIAVDLPDGGIPGDRPESLLHLVDGSIESVNLVSAAGGAATREGTVQLARDLLTALSPVEIHALELAGTHGYDHSSHMLSSAFLLWGAARSGYAGPLDWHRGYNVSVEPATLVGGDFEDATQMLGFYEGCATSCGECGFACPPDALNAAHVTWLARQYAATRVREARGKLASGDRCLLSSLQLGDCSTASSFVLAADGRLMLDGDCLTAADDSTLTVASCDNNAAQYWVFDSEGSVWNGLPPRAAGDMTYDHVRCLAAAATSVSVPTCGAHTAVAWRFID